MQNNTYDSSIPFTKDEIVFISKTTKKAISKTVEYDEEFQDFTLIEGEEQKSKTLHQILTRIDVFKKANKKSKHIDSLHDLLCRLLEENIVTYKELEQYSGLTRSNISNYVNKITDQNGESRQKETQKFKEKIISGIRKILNSKIFTILETLYYIDNRQK